MIRQETRLNAPPLPPGRWDNLARSRPGAWRAPASFAAGRLFPPTTSSGLLEAVIEPGAGVCIEGNTRNRPDLPRPQPVRRSRPPARPAPGAVGARAAEHIDLTTRPGEPYRLLLLRPQAGRLARWSKAGKYTIGAIHTYSSCSPRYFGRPDARGRPHRGPGSRPAGHLYTGPHQTPAIVEATAFKGGSSSPRSTETWTSCRRRHPADWVNFVVQAPTPLHRAAVHAAPPDHRDPGADAVSRSRACTPSTASRA